MFTKSHKKHLRKQVEVFLEWAKKHHRLGPSYKEWLDLFIEKCDKLDVYDITEEDTAQYKEHVYNATLSNYSQIHATRAINSLLTFYMARTKNQEFKRGRGKPPRIEMILQAKELRAHKYSYREIAVLLDANLSLVYRWSKYPLERLKRSYPHLSL